MEITYRCAIVFGALIVATGWMAACSGEDARNAADTSGECTPGEVATCSCTGETDGTRECDGGPSGDCRCPGDAGTDVDAATGDAADADADATDGGLEDTDGSASSQCEFHRDCGRGELCAKHQCTALTEVFADRDIYWVDQKNGDDSNPGTRSKPFETIGATTGSDVLAPGVVVVIREGVYRESIRPEEGGTPSRRVTWVAYPGEEVVVSGADVVETSWSEQSDGSWRHDWSWEALGAGGRDESEVAYRRELFVDDGEVLRPVGSRQDLEPGTFFVKGTDEQPEAVFLRTVDDTDPNDHRIEVGLRSQLFWTRGEYSHKCGQTEQGYYRLIGLKFVHSTSRRQRMAVCPGHAGSRLEEIVTNWHNGGGIKIVGENHLVRGVIANHNGIEGIGGTDCTNCLVEYSEVAHNNWIQDGPNNHGGGGKFTLSTDSHFRFNHYHDNNGPGLWLDIDNTGNRVYGNRFSDNYSKGLFIELRSNRNYAYNNVITGSIFAGKPFPGVGIIISASSENVLAYNTLIRNDGGGIKIFGDDREDAGRNRVYNNLLLNNTIADARGDVREMMITGGGGGVDTQTAWENVSESEFDGNAYSSYPPGEANYDLATFLYAPRSADEREPKTTNRLADWQGALGFDESGMMVDESSPVVKDPSDPADGWRLTPDSQLRDGAVELPSDLDFIDTDIDGDPRPDDGGDIGADQFN